MNEYFEKIFWHTSCFHTQVSRNSTGVTMYIKYISNTLILVLFVWVRHRVKPLIWNPRPLEDSLSIYLKHMDSG